MSNAKTDPQPGQACKLDYEHDNLAWECYSRDTAGNGTEWVGILTLNKNDKVEQGQIPLGGWIKRFEDGVVVRDDIISEKASQKILDKIKRFR